MKISKLALAAALLIMTASNAFAAGNVAYEYGTQGYEFIGDDADNNVYVIPTILNDGETPGVWVFGYQTAINGQTDEFGNGNMMLTTGRNIRVNLGDGDDQITINSLELANRNISVIGGGGYDTLDSIGCRVDRLFLERVDEVNFVDLTCGEMSVNEYSGNQVPHRLSLTLEDVEIYGDLFVEGIKGQNDVISLINTIVWGETTMDLNSGDDLLYLDTVWFIDGLLAEFEMGNDMLYCDGNVYAARDRSRVDGGRSRRRGQTNDIYNDRYIINGTPTVQLGSIVGWDSFQ